MMQSQSTVSGEFSFSHALGFVGAALVSLLVCLALYALQALRYVQASPVPSTYKWFLLQEVPGPRLIIEAGSNAHHGFDTDMISEALNITAINIADNAGYDLEQKVARLAAHTRPGDVIILPLEWSYYTREELTDDFVEQIPTLNRDYVNSVSLWDRLRLVFSLPPAAVLGFGGEVERPSEPTRMTPLQALYVDALIRPSGHFSYEISRPPGPGVSDKSCDAYLFWDSGTEVSEKLKRALKRLARLKARGIDVYLTWPVVVGDTCLSDMDRLSALVEQVEREVTKVGLEFLGRPTQSLYPLRYRDDTPYHLTREGTALHTERFIERLNQHGIRPNGTHRDISRFARTRIYELEYKQLNDDPLLPLPLDQTLGIGDKATLNHVDFAAGWWVFEPYGRWMRDNEAALRLHLPEGLEEGAQLQLVGMIAGFGVERANLLMNGQVIGAGLLGGDNILSANLDQVPQGEEVLLKLRFPEMSEVLSPYDRGQNADKRTMSFHFQTLTLRSQSEGQPDQPVTAAPEVLSVSLGGGLQFDEIVGISMPAAETVITFEDGWWDREAAGRWMGCCEATIMLNLPPQLPPGTALKLSGDVFEGGAVSVEAFIDNVRVTETFFSVDNPLIVPLAQAYPEGRLAIRLRVSGREFQSPEVLGLSGDTRILSIFLKSLELSTQSRSL